MKKPTAQEIAITHGWKAKDKKNFKHKKFPLVMLIIQPSGEWEVPHKAKGKTCRTLLDFLTKFHQQTLPLKKAKAKPEAAPKPQHDVNDMNPRIEEGGHYMQGPVRFAVDVDDLFRTLSCGPFGIGQQQERYGILANLGETELKRFAEVNGLPVKPFARELLIEVLRCPLQDAWFKACYDPAVHPGLVDNPEKRALNFVIRKQQFQSRFDAYTRTAGEKAERLKANGAHLFQRKEDSTWMATAKLTAKLVAKVKGQQQPILQWLLKNKGTRAEIAEAVASKLTTKQKPVLVVSHYLPEWKKKGWITQ